MGELNSSHPTALYMLPHKAVPQHRLWKAGSYSFNLWLLQTMVLLPLFQTVAQQLLWPSARLWVAAVQLEENGPGKSVSGFDRRSTSVGLSSLLTSGCSLQLTALTCKSEMS